MKKLILVDSFHTEEELTNLTGMANQLSYFPTQFGEETDFQIPLNNFSNYFSNFLEGNYRVQEKESGIFRKPMMNIHFESAESSNDWVFFSVLKQTTFNLFQHNSGVENAIQSTNLNFSDFTEWNYTTNILLEPNQGLFFRPWLFHSIQGGLINYYRLTK